MTVPELQRVAYRGDCSRGEGGENGREKWARGDSAFH